MQTCFFAISGVLPRDEAIAQIKKAIEKTYGKRGPEVVRRNFEAVDRDARAPARGAGAGDGHRDAHAAAARARARARLRAAGHGGDARRQGRPAAGQRVPGRRHLADWHREMGEAQHRARDPGLGPEGLHPVQQVRAGLPARGHPRQGLRRRARWPARRRRSSRRAYKGNEYQGQAVHDPGGARGLHRLHLCVDVCPAKDKHQPEAQGDQHGAAGAAARRRSATTTTSSSICPRSIARTIVQLDLKGSQFLEPLFEYSGACAGCGETPYLKLLTQLFGDRAADRQRHRLLVDLRRQPADDAVHDEPRRARPGLVELALRGQRRVRLRLPAGARRARRDRARPAAARWRRRSATAWRRRSSTPISRARPASPRSASGSRRCGASSPACRPPRRAGSRRSPTIS